MKLDQIFGVILILLAIYLGVSVAYEDGDPGLLGGLDDPIPVEPADPGAGSNGAGESDGTGDGGSSTSGDGTSSGDGDGTGGGSSDDGGGDGASSGDGDGTGGGGSDEAARQRRAANREQPIVTSNFCADAPSSSQWSDLRAAHDAAVKCMEGAEVVTEIAAGEYNPRDAVTRGQAAEGIASMIDAANRLELEGVDLRGLPEADDPRFADVTEETPHELAIARLDETPILQGYVDARFEPDARVTRAQMASMLDRSYQYMNRTALPIGPDLFDDDNRSVHEESINATAAADIMAGVSDDRFAPQRSVLRDEFAGYLARIMIRMEDKNRIAPL